MFWLWSFTQLFLDFSPTIIVSAFFKNPGNLFGNLFIFPFKSTFVIQIGMVVIRVDWNIKDVTHCYYRIFVSVSSNHIYLRLMIRAPCFKISFSILTHCFSLRNRAYSFSSSERLSLEANEPVSLCFLIQRSNAEGVISYSLAISARDFPFS